MIPANKIFKRYDIRGIYPDEINGEIASGIAKAFVIFIKEKFGIDKPIISVGRDGRNSSPEIYDAVCNSLIVSGAIVKSLGIVTTPLTYFSSVIGKSEFSIMVTASHNPGIYNGLKFSKGVMPIFFENGLNDVLKIFLQGKKIKGIGDIEMVNILNDYKRYILSKFMFSGNRKFVVDAGNGVSGKVFESVAKDLNLNYVPLFFEIDGDFPNHEANPMKKETLTALKDKVISENADFGVAFDGDGDRFGLVDENGIFRTMDEIIALLADYESNEKKGTFFIDLRCSKFVSEIIESKGGTIVKLPVGNPYYKKKLLEDSNGILGAELSGHIMFKENHCIDDAVFNFLKVLEIFEKDSRKISEILEHYKKYPKIPEINFTVENPERVINKIKEEFKDYSFEELDGLTVKSDNWWFNIRRSNTEPLIRLNAEANRESELNELVEKIKDVVSRN